MTPATYVVLSGTLTFGSALFLGLRELALLRRDRSGGGGRWENAEPPKPPPLPPGTSPPLKALPACLIPVLPPARPMATTAGVRVRELA